MKSLLKQFQKHMSSGTMAPASLYGTENKHETETFLKRKLVWILFGSILIFQAHCAKSLTPQTACGFVQNSEGQRVSWKNQPIVKLYFDTSVPPEFQSAIQNAIATWERAIGRHIFEIAGTIAGTRPTQDNRSIIYWMPSWDQSSNLQQANTTIYWVDSNITEADVRVNAQNFHFSTNPSYGDVDIESLMVHEFGHVLGLRHVDEVPSVMAKSLSLGFERRTLYTTDATDIKCEY